MPPMPTEWWLRPVSSACRVGEHSAVVWNRLNFSPPRREPLGGRRRARAAERARRPEPTSSSSTTSTFGAPAGGRSGRSAETSCPDPSRHHRQARRMAYRDREHVMVGATGCGHPSSFAYGRLTPASEIVSAIYSAPWVYGPHPTRKIPPPTPPWDGRRRGAQNALERPVRTRLPHPCRGRLWRRLVRPALVVAAARGRFGWLLPQFIDYQEVWEALTELEGGRSPSCSCSGSRASRRRR